MRRFWMLACLTIVCAGSSASWGQPPVADCERARTIRQQVASTQSMPPDVKKKLLDLAAGLCPESVDVSGLLVKAEEALDKGKFPDALEQLEKAVASNPAKACPKVLELARKLAGQNQVGQAIALFETALSSFENKEAFAEYQQLLDKVPTTLAAKGPAKLISKDSIVRSLRARPTEVFPEDDLVGSRVVFHNILFKSGSAELTTDSKDQLDELGQALASPDLAHVELFYIDGHTDSIGTVQRNCDLGYQRSKSVISYLVTSCNVRARKLVPRSYGQNNPVGDNSGADGRLQNRRVEVLNGDVVHREDADGRERCR